MQQNFNTVSLFRTCALLLLEKAIQIEGNNKQAMSGLIYSLTMSQKKKMAKPCLLNFTVVVFVFFL